VPNGTYFLYRGGTDEDNASTGDLDVLENLNVQATYRNRPVIDGNDIDRIFDVHGSHELTLSGLTLKNGTVVSGGINGGGAIRLYDQFSSASIDACSKAIRLSAKAQLSITTVVF